MNCRIGISSPLFSTKRLGDMGDRIFSEFGHFELIAEGTLDLHHTGATLAKMAEEHSATLSVHLPMSDINIGAFSDEIRAFSVGVISEQMRLGAKLGATLFTLHPGNMSPLTFGNKKPALKANMQSLAELAGLASELDIELALENMPMPHLFLGAEPEEFLDMLKEFISMGGYWCFDMGHANTVGAIDTLLSSGYGSSIRNIHVHDNRGDNDDHLPIGKGNINIEATIRKALKAGAHPKQFIIESRNLEEGIKSRKALEDILSSVSL